MLLDRGTGRKLVLVALISFDLIANVVIEAQKIFVSQIFDCHKHSPLALFEDRHEIFDHEITCHVGAAAERHQPDR
jgi:hypothetical protein